MVTKLEQIRIADNAVERFQSDVVNKVNPILKLPILDGIEVKSVSLDAASDAFVDHGLGRDPNYIVTKNTANAVVYDDQVNNSTRKSTLKLKTSANTTVDLWIY